jgi:hypothetical protein
MNVILALVSLYLAAGLGLWFYVKPEFEERDQVTQLAVLLACFFAWPSILLTELDEDI